jgi:hypothetical protein
MVIRIALRQRGEIELFNCIVLPLHFEKLTEPIIV